MSPSDRLHDLLRAACEEALYAILGAGPRSLDGLAKRRQPTHETIARDGTANVTMMADWDAWRRSLAYAMAPIGAAWFVPMRDAIDHGLTLERQPSGLRAVLPFGTQAAIDRVRREGAFALRVARWVSASDAVLSADETRSLDLLLASLALPEDDQRVLAAEGVVPLQSLEIPEGIEPKLARAIVTGAWEVAAIDGLDAAEANAISAVATRIGIDTEDLQEARAAAEKQMRAQHLLGLAIVDAVRYVVAPLPDPDVQSLVTAAVHLSVPIANRTEVLRATTVNEATPMVREHDLDRTERLTALAAAWAAALAADPSVSLRARLAKRHDRVAAQLGGERRARDARELVEEYLEPILGRGVDTAGG